jgi:pimeloyl-ACP methyl ester carboxylesterase
MIEKFAIELPNKISLSCRAAGPEYAPVLLFLHGFPEAAFVWDEMLEHFSRHYRCIAPNLRGYERSSHPEGVEAYRAKHLVGDIAALVDQLGGPLEALVAHDWGGAIAWNFAVQHPKKLKRLVIINSPHPATFLRELKNNPAQQAASTYMNFLCRPDAAQLLEADDFELAWHFLQGPGDTDASRPGANWLTEPMKERYREVWSLGMEGAVNYYRASPLRPPTETDKAILQVELPAEHVTVKVPTRVVWAEGDSALLPGLIDGLDEYIPDLTLVRVPHASHWVIHEQPTRIAQEIEAALAVDVSPTV